MMPATITAIKEALELRNFDARSAQGRMAPIVRTLDRPADLVSPPRLGGVLALFYYRSSELYLVLTKRRDDLPSHPGQISFPGGRNEKPESLLATALRETEEEIGVGSLGIEILGRLTPIYIPPTDYEVHPFVAWFNDGQEPEFKAEPREVAQIIEVPLAVFLDPAARVEEMWEIGGQQIAVPYFAVGEHKVWGATAIMLSELIERLRVVLD